MLRIVIDFLRPMSPAVSPERCYNCVCGWFLNLWDRRMKRCMKRRLMTRFCLLPYGLRPAVLRRSRRPDFPPLGSINSWHGSSLSKFHSVCKSPIVVSSPVSEYTSINPLFCLASLHVCRNWRRVNPLPHRFDKAIWKGNESDHLYSIQQFVEDQIGDSVPRIHCFFCENSPDISRIRELVLVHRRIITFIKLYLVRFASFFFVEVKLFKYMVSSGLSPSHALRCYDLHMKGMSPRVSSGFFIRMI